MATVTITGPSIRDSVSTKDNRPWRVWAQTYQSDGDGGVITTRKSRPVYPTAGVFTVELEAGIVATLENPDGDTYLVTVPNIDSDLWDLIAAAVAFPPTTSAEFVDDAVQAYLDTHPFMVESDSTPKLGGNLDLDGNTVGDATEADLTALHGRTSLGTDLVQATDAAAARESLDVTRRLVFDPRDFDPNLEAGQGFGTTYDSTPGIQAALDAAAAVGGAGYGGAIVQLPHGVFKVSGLVIGDNTIFAGSGENTYLFLPGGSNANLIQSDKYGDATLWNRSIIIRDMFLNGNQANQSATLHPQAYLTANYTLGDATIAVDDTTGFANSGTLLVGWSSITYTGKTGTSFTGCASTGDSGTVRQGAWVTPFNSQGHLIAIQGRRCKLSNLYGVNGAGSGVYLQGPYDGQYQPENVLENLRMDACRRYSFEVGPNASDGWGRNLVGGDCPRGFALVRGGNWDFTATHPATNATTYSTVGPAYHLAGVEARITDCFFDTWPGTPIMLDCTVQGISRIANVQLSNLRTFQSGYAGGSAVVFKGNADQACERVHISDANFFAPFDWTLSSGPATLTVGTIDLTSPPSGKVQVRNANDFAPSSAVGGAVLVGGTDTLSYTGRQMAGTFAHAASVGDTTLNVDSTTGFDNAGTLLLTTIDTGGLVFHVQQITYTGKTDTSFTGIPASSAGSIQYVVNGWPECVTQHYLTGVTGGVTASMATGSSVASTPLSPVVTELTVASALFRGFQKAAHRLNGASDTFQFLGGWQGGRAAQSTTPYRTSSADTTIDALNDGTLVLTGGDHTFTIPAAYLNRGAVFSFKNRGSGTLTVAGPTNSIYAGGVVSSFTVPPGGAASVASDGTYWGVLINPSPTLLAPILGTPASGTLTNCTGLPVAGITASTSQALGVGSVEVGHASDTTLARLSAGIISVEGEQVPLWYDDPFLSDLHTSGESTLFRRMVTSQSVATTSQTLRLTYFTARKTESIGNVRIISGSTAAGATPSLIRVGIYTVDGSGNLTLVASTANDTSLLASGTTEYPKALQASFTKTRGQRYAVGVLVVTAATAPTLTGGGNLIPSAAAGRAPRLGGSVTGQSDLPSSVSAGSINDNAHQAYVELTP